MINIRQKKLILSALSIFSVIIILALFLNMNYVQNRFKSQDFYRHYENDFMQMDRNFQVEANLSEIKYFNGKLYLFNYIKKEIIQFDTLGKPLNRYKENIDPNIDSHIIGWDVDENGIYLADSRRYLLTHLGFDNTVLTQFDPEQVIHRGFSLKGNQFIIVTPNLKDSSNLKKLTMMLVDLEGKTKRKLDYPFPDIEDSRMKMSGFFIKNDVDRIFYVCFMTGLFVSINDQGEFQYLAKTIDKSPYPNILDNGISRSFDPLSPIVNISADADAEYLYILSLAISESDRHSDSPVMDVYRIDDGSYVKSYLVPPYEGKGASRVAVGPNGFYFIQGKNITHYQIIENNQLHLQSKVIISK